MKEVPNWSSPEIPDMNIYRMRERDRLAAKNAALFNSWREQGAINSPPPKPISASPGWEGFNEGLNFNDTIANAGPDAKYKVLGLLQGLPTRIGRK
jgi:hypothetical protein